ncbi:MAG TPA: KH domain-containing protein [Desulfobacterales bacterium]|uniref:KH domain RNA binding protein YlqC n=1 Tax=hydrothermal vent metagenome TaxID=652676 RepID=A0A3B0V953_9ZZZZ|nr:KH domain-containing protein [Desulfobacterales bacterium]
MKELVSFIARALVDKPEEVRVDEVDADGTILEELRVAQDDLGKVIGKQGRTARAIRTLLSASARKVDKRARLEIIE